MAYLQPGASQGSVCGLPTGGTLVGDQLYIILYTPNSPPGNAAPITVEEYLVHQVQETIRGPNGTVNETISVQYSITWSNATAPAAAGQAQILSLTVPSVTGTESLFVSVMGVPLQASIVVPGAGIAIPTTYPQLLLHDVTYQVYVVAFIAVGVGVAAIYRWRVRHVERIWPFGGAGVVASAAFGGWVYLEYPQSTIPLGSLPEFLVAVPAIFAGAYLYLAIAPTVALLHKIEYPVADVRDGSRLYGEKRFRVFANRSGTKEYIGPGGAGAGLRFLGIRTEFDDRLLTPAPYKIGFSGFRSPRWDTYARYYAWSEFEGGPKTLEVVPPRAFWFPGRKKARQAIAEYHRTALKGRVPAPDHVGLLVYVTPSKAFAAVVGKQGAILVEGWISGSLQSSKMGIALEKILAAYTHLKVTLKAQAIDYGHKVALALRMAEDFPGSPVALKALEDLATRHEAAIMDEREWLRFLEQKVEEDRTPTDARAVGAAEKILNEATSPVPPDLREYARQRGTEP